MSYCHTCKKTIRKDRRIFCTNVHHIESDKTICLIPYENDCYLCGVKKYRKWLTDNNFKCNSRFQKEFWIYHFPEYKDLILNREKGKGSLSFYLQKGKTEKDYKQKNKQLSVGIDSLKQRGVSDSDIERIRKQHKKNSLITENSLSQKYGKKEGKRKWESRLEKAKHTTCWGLQYWIDKGYSKINAEKILHKFQDRGSKE